MIYKCICLRSNSVAVRGVVCGTRGLSLIPKVFSLFVWIKQQIYKCYKCLWRICPRCVRSKGGRGQMPFGPCLSRLAFPTGEAKTSWKEKKSFNNWLQKIKRREKNWEKETQLKPTELFWKGSQRWHSSSTDLKDPGYNPARSRAFSSLEII